MGKSYLVECVKEPNQDKNRTMREKLKNKIKGKQGPEGVRQGNNKRKPNGKHTKKKG